MLPGHKELPALLGQETEPDSDFFPLNHNPFASIVSEQILSLLLAQIENDPASKKTLLTEIWNSTRQLPPAPNLEVPMQVRTRNWVIYQYGKNPLAFFDDLLRVADENRPELIENQLTVVAILLSNIFASHEVRSNPHIEDDLRYELIRAWQNSIGSDRPRRKVIEYVLLHNPLFFWKQLEMLLLFESTEPEVKEQILSTFAEIQLHITFQAEELPSEPQPMELQQNI